MANTRKTFYVIAYDIAKDRNRNHIAGILEKYGSRVNYSVFECLLTDTQLEKIKNEISKKISSKTDSVVYYPLCIDCYVKIERQGRKYVERKDIVVTF